jgi:hypothetical protein
MAVFHNINTCLYQTRQTDTAQIKYTAAQYTDPPFREFSGSKPLLYPELICKYLTVKTMPYKYQITITGMHDLLHNTSPNNAT